MPDILTNVREVEPDNLVRGWEVIIGLEIHAQMATVAKLFSGSATQFGAEANTHVSYIDGGFPGMLPVPNRACIDVAIRTGLALDATVNPYSVFARKNYFYPDLPQGYQISQYDQPIVSEGHLIIDLPYHDGAARAHTIRIERLHIEQDAGKSIHDQYPDKSLIDLNRSGCALMEIVSYPDLRSAAEACAYVAEIRAVLRAIGTCDGNMQEGHLRADANVSVHRPGTPYGTRAEIKNLNSIRFLGQAIEHETHRQIDLLEAGGTVVQETRLFDSTSGVTRSMRSKEDAHDYRYFPDPDLLPIVLTPEDIAACADLPELPRAKRHRFIAELGISNADAATLVAEGERAVFFEQVLAGGRDAKIVANWVISELLGVLNRMGVAISESPISAQQLGALIDLIQDGTISGRIAKELFAEMAETPFTTPLAEVVAARGLGQVSDSGALEQLIRELIDTNGEQVERYRAGNTKLRGWFVGQVMKSTGGKANPQVVNDLLTRLLDGS